VVTGVELFTVAPLTVAMPHFLKSAVYYRFTAVVIDHVNAGG
jgi:hypothetical protein